MIHVGFIRLEVAPSVVILKMPCLYMHIHMETNQTKPVPLRNMERKISNNHHQDDITCLVRDSNLSLHLPLTRKGDSCCPLRIGLFPFKNGLVKRPKWLINGHSWPFGKGSHNPIRFGQRSNDHHGFNSEV